MVFILSVIGSFLLTVTLGVRQQYAAKCPKEYIAKTSLVGFVLIPIVGGAEGSLYSHSFSIPWWIFGLLNFVVICATSIAIIGISMIFKRIRKTYYQV